MAKSSIPHNDEKPVREHDKFMLRLPDGLRERIWEKAQENDRSMNAEIVNRIITSLDHNTEEMRLEIAYLKGMISGQEAARDIFEKHIIESIKSGQPVDVDSLREDFSAKNKEDNKPRKTKEK